MFVFRVAMAKQDIVRNARPLMILLAKLTYGERHASAAEMARRRLALKHRKSTRYR